MSRGTFNMLFVAAILFAIVGVFIQASVWNECRAEGHSFFYCMNLLSSK